MQKIYNETNKVNLKSILISESIEFDLKTEKNNVLFQIYGSNQNKD